MEKFKKWWKGRTLNEKLMYALILILVIGIATRWRYVFNEIGEAFTGLVKGVEQVDGKNVKAAKRPEFVIVDVPQMLLGSDKAAPWLADHFWDKTELADSNFAGYPSVMEEAMKPWGEILLMVDDKLAAKSVKSFLDKASGDSAALRVAIDKIEWAFYDPNSPVRNFEAYISALEWIIASDKVSEIEKMRPVAHLERVLKNRKGSKAHDFKYVDSKGVKGNLYGVKAAYTLLFFYNPDCPSCADYKQALLGSPVVESFIRDGRMVILGVYPDGDANLWKTRQGDFPVDWINGMDMGQTIEAEGSYELNVIPTLLLLDKEKVVLLKDAQPSQVENFLVRSVS